MFRFKQFSVRQSNVPLKVGTDACLLGAWAAGGKTILDIGTGTGILALMMAQRYPEAEITAIDIQAELAREAAFNFKCSPWSHRLKSEVQDLLTWQTDVSFDAIICNPPYFSGAVLSGVKAKDLARHSTSLGLSELFRWSKNHLNPNGCFSLIYPANDSVLLAEAFNVGFNATRCLCVASQPDEAPIRRLWEFSLATSNFCKEEMSLESPARNVYSFEYWNLLKDYHLDF
jgi:tRNA1Val (adenine37-N6)-methyltransferase